MSARRLIKRDKYQEREAINMPLSTHEPTFYTYYYITRNNFVAPETIMVIVTRHTKINSWQALRQKKIFAPKIKFKSTF